jgi:micrococcal nuclease
MLPSLQQAIQAIKAGDKETGRKILADILQADLENEQAWLWLSSVVDSDIERRKYLQRVLEINPDNKAAQRGLAILNEKLGDQAEADKAIPAEKSPEPEKTLGARLAAVQQKKAIQAEPKPQPIPARPASPEPPPEPPGSEAEPVEPPQSKIEPGIGQAQEVEPSPIQAREEVEPQPEPEISHEVSEIRRQFEQPPEAPLGLALYRLKLYWNTERGMLIISGAGVGLILICAACIVFSLVFRPILNQAPATIIAIVGTETPTPTPTPIPPTPTPTLTFTPAPPATFTPTPTPTNTPVVLATATVTPTPTRTPTQNPNLQSAQVVSVVAGDMIDVVIDGELFRVKYILVDAPELDLPGVGPEPFAAEALEFNRRLVEGQTVTLEKDVSQTDSAGRLLRYVYVGDLMVNEELLRQGLVRVELIPPDLKYGARLQEVERNAQAANIGIWSLE